MKKVIVLGSNGQLGMTIKDFADRETIEFIFLSRSQLDITDKKGLTEALKFSDYDYCINCAAYTDVESAEKNIEDAFLINAEGVKNIAEVCRESNIKLIHISTDYVFNGKKEKPYTTTDNTNPINEYGKSKLKGEFYIQEQLDKYYIVRVSWLYSLHGKNFFKTIANKIKNDEVLNITLEQEGTPTSCLDLAEFILHLVKLDTMPYGIYNFSANGSTTWYGFAQEIVRNLNPKRLDKIQPSEQFITLAERPKYSVFNLQKVERLYRNLSRWEKSVRIMVENYKKNIT